MTFDELDARFSQQADNEYRYLADAYGGNQDRSNGRK
jgi:hypothetical protein